MSYAFRNGSPFTGNADEVQNELDLIRKTVGLTPRNVVTAARPKRSSLHKYIFHVDDKAAAEKYFEARAQNLICSIVVIHDEENTVPSRVRANVRVGPASYESITQPEAREIEIKRVKREMRYLADTLAELELYPEVTTAIEFALES